MIPGALRAAAEYIDDHARIKAWDIHHRATETQQAVKADKVRAVAQDLGTLADDAETRNVRYAEYQILKDRLYALGFAVTPKLEQEVATAFRDAGGPMSVRAQGWMKQP